MLAVASVPQQRNNQADVTPESYQQSAVCSRSSISSSREKCARKTSRVSKESASMSATVLGIENIRPYEPLYACHAGPIRMGFPHGRHEDEPRRAGLHGCTGTLPIIQLCYPCPLPGRTALNRSTQGTNGGDVPHTILERDRALERFRRTKTSNPLLRTEDERAHERSRIDATDWTAVSNR